MDYTIEIKKTVKITLSDIVDYILCCEAGGFDYWAELCTDEADYTAAKSRLLENADGETVNPCYEEVLGEILRNGGKITVYDREDDKEYELTLEKLLDGWKKHIEKGGSDDFDMYDANDADGVLQYAIFGDWIYG